ncbi:MAG: hypothetical protein EA382_06845 [Spirochaetaceae bacterium]|nr:MAG: hypothetical protein EA382_06845 [Spirochaetaceae bacterium]
MVSEIAAQRVSTYAERTLSDQTLRGCAARSARLLALLQERMTKPQLSWGRDLAVIDERDAGMPLVLRQAAAFERIVTGMPIDIEPGDLIVGNTVRDGIVVRTQTPEFTTSAERERAAAEGAGIGAGLSHKTPYYYGVLDGGLNSVIAETERKGLEIESQPESDDRTEKLAHLAAVTRECRAVIAMAGRYAELALVRATEAETNGNTERADELREIAAVCRRVPADGARSFHEAVQSFWFIHYALFSTNTRLSCGRLDQYLYPYLHADLEAGAITPARAQEIVDALWIRFNDRAQIRRENFYVSEDECARLADAGRGGFVVRREPSAGLAGHRKRYGYSVDAADAINHFGQNILLSGVRPDGCDGTNALTYHFLNALEKFPFTSPVVSLRLHSDSPQELRHRAAEVLKAGGGMPYINNDDVLVKAYTDLDVPIEDARDYANSNCWETMIEGRSDQELIRGMNFLLCMELVLNRGVSKVLGAMGPDTGDPLTFETFDDLMAAWKVQLDEQLRLGIEYIGSGVMDGTLEHSSHGRYRYNPFLSALTLDCLRREKDVIRGGARYTIWHVMGEAVANAIDAMAAIRRLVFDDRTVEFAELLAALDANWDGHENLRRLIVHRMPKFANDDAYADEIGRDMMRFFVERTRHHAARFPTIVFPASVGTFSWFAMIGKEVAASADGRRDFEPIAANFSPVPGADLSGPTAAIGSYLSMFVSKLAAGAPIDLRLSSHGLDGEAGTERLAGLITAFVQLGGNMLTLTVTDVEELKRAMVEPERYRHLRVRMGGWSAYFVALGEEQQRLHISRVEHGLV